MPGQLLQYRVGRTLGSGASCKVKLGTDQNGRKVAIKIMKEMDAKMKELVLTECEAMDKLKHVNIIDQIERGNGVYKKDSGKEKNIDFIVLELAEGGEVFDFVAISGRFEEPLARYYFKQFMEGLAYCHQQGITHRDLKPENLLLDHEFIMKIADFGFAGPIAGRDGLGNLRTKLGTLNYMAPEIHLKQPYKGEAIDLFAAGIILFIMVAQHPPFTTAQPQDPFYRCIAGNRADIFWRTHCKNKKGGESFFSNDFKELIQSILQLDPNSRPSIAEVLNHQWMKGPMPTSQEIAKQFTSRNEKVKASAEADREAKQAEKLQKEKDLKGFRGPSKGIDEEAKGENIFEIREKIDDFDGFVNVQTAFFTTSNPTFIEDVLCQHLRNEHKQEPTTISKTKYKVKFSLPTNVQGVNEPMFTDMTMKIYKVSDSKFCVEFTKQEGDQTHFVDHYKGIMEKCLKFANDATLQ